MRTDGGGPLEWNHRDQGEHPFDTTLLVLTCDELANYVIDNGGDLVSKAVT